MKFGIDRLLEEPAAAKPLAGRRVALLAHPASVTREPHAFARCTGRRGRQAHGRVRSAARAARRQAGQHDRVADFTDPVHGIPVFSLYGAVRRPTDEMMRTFDVLLVDLQDLGCRVYTFLTTLRYVLEAAARHGKSVWVLDRPNPVGRPIEGLKLRAAGRASSAPARCRCATASRWARLERWFVRTLRLDVDYQVMAMKGWKPKDPLAARRARVGQPEPERAEPFDGALLPRHGDARRHDAVRGRGTTRPLEILGAPGLDSKALLEKMNSLAPVVARLRAAAVLVRADLPQARGEACAGLQVHVEAPHYAHEAFSPWRLVALAFKALAPLPEYELWRDFPTSTRRGSRST